MTLQEAMAKYVGEVTHLSHIDYREVDEDRYRINYWVNNGRKNSVIPTKLIKHSYFIEFNAEKNIFVDRTVPPTYNLDWI